MKFVRVSTVLSVLVTQVTSSDNDVNQFPHPPRVAGNNTLFIKTNILNLITSK